MEVFIMVVCNNCGENIEEGKKFCSSCGTPVVSTEIEIKCPNCGVIIVN
jgi:predicted RNA-binding Zn-ribbon protein involved in translation (DUF1610 family)